jgi:periplasmic protein TonB
MNSVRPMMGSRESLFGGRRGWLFAAISIVVHLALAGVVVAIGPAAGPPAEEPRITVDLVAPALEPILPDPVAPSVVPRPQPRRKAHLPRRPFAQRREAPSPGPMTFTAAASPRASGPANGVGVGAEGAPGPAGGSGVGGSGGAGSGGATSPAPRRAALLAVATAPQPVDSRSPDYPRTARRRRAEGVVLIRARVGRRGEVLEVHVAQTSGASDLDRSALEAVKGWRFRPAMHGRDPLEAWVNVPIRFQLSSR